MAVTIPSDIVLDVAQAADSAGVEAARARLASATAARRTDSTFEVAQAAVSENPAQADKVSARRKDSLVKFEAMVLRNFVEQMLPKSSEAVYGKGLAGDMWKSMMAEKMANVMSERGGVGIADRVLKDYFMRGEEKVPVEGVPNSQAKLDRDAQALQAKALVQELQLNLVRSISQELGGGTGDDRI